MNNNQKYHLSISYLNDIRKITVNSNTKISELIKKCLDIFDIQINIISGIYFFFCDADVYLGESEENDFNKTFNDFIEEYDHNDSRIFYIDPINLTNRSQSLIDDFKMKYAIYNNNNSQNYYFRPVINITNNYNQGFDLSSDNETNSNFFLNLLNSYSRIRPNNLNQENRTQENTNRNQESINRNQENTNRTQENTNRNQENTNRTQENTNINQENTNRFSWERPRSNDSDPNLRVPLTSFWNLPVDGQRTDSYISPTSNLLQSIFSSALQNQNTPAYVGAFYSSLNGLFNQENSVLSPIQLSHLRRGEYESLKNEGLILSECTQCNITLEDFSPNTMVIALPCKHAFQENAIRHWLLNNSNRCPVCRAEVAEGRNINNIW